MIEYGVKVYRPVHVARLTADPAKPRSWRLGFDRYDWLVWGLIAAANALLAVLKATQPL